MIKDVDLLVSHITEEIRKDVDVAVVGMSGGADSTLVAILCKLALGGDNVYSVHMPYNHLDEKTFNSNSQRIAKKLGLKRITSPIGELVLQLNNAVSTAVASVSDSDSNNLSHVNEGNSRSRARMTILYGVSHHLNEKLSRRVRVIGTGNLSEDFIGYDTKGGDALCDIFPIGELFKSEVYQLLEHFRDRGFIVEEDIDRTPSAGLWDEQTDEEELGYSYDDLEPGIKECLAFMEAERNLEGFKPTTDVQRFVVERHLVNKHKHEAPLVISARQYCV